MYCIKCGKEISENEAKQNSNFCNNCKATINKSQEKNKVARRVNVTAQVICVISTIIGMISMIFSFAFGISLIISAFVLATIMEGLSEIIQLLEDIKNK